MSEGPLTPSAGNSTLKRVYLEIINEKLFINTGVSSGQWEQVRIHQADSTRSCRGCYNP